LFVLIFAYISFIPIYYFTIVAKGLEARKCITSQKIFKILQKLKLYPNGTVSIV